MSKQPRKAYNRQRIACDVPGCKATVKTIRGLARHKDTKHAPPPSPPPVQFPSLTAFRTPSPNPPPSPIFSSRRSPRRRQNGSPVRLSWAAAPLSLPFRKSVKSEVHPVIDGTPCDIHSNDLPQDSIPPPLPPRACNDFSPFDHRAEFEFAEFLYQQEQMPQKKIDRLTEILAALYPESDPPFANHKEIFTVKYNGELPEDTLSLPKWKTQEYEVWFRNPLSILENMLANPSFKHEFDEAPKRLKRKGKRVYRDLMSGNWAWEQCDEIAKDEDTHGAMFVPVILGSDKTTVSVATGQNDYYLLYISLGNVHSSVRRAHRNAVALLGFLAVPKTSAEHSGSAEFRKFRRQLFHSSLENILSHLRPHMTVPRVTRCPDGHYRRAIYGLGPYIADYPEQALLACIVQNWCPRCSSSPNNLDANEGRRSHQLTDALSEGCSLKEMWDDYGIVADLIPFTASFPRADIHELLAPDILHQLVKGTFKDHLVDWVFEYIDKTYSKQEAEARRADIDRRIMTTTPFVGLRQFHEGRGFKQWTGADSKGLMKVFLPAIVGHVPPDMVRAVQDFLEFCYLVRRDVISEDDLAAIDTAVHSFHRHREIFRTTGVRPDGFSLPRQHSMIHYRHLIQQFGAPNGLCSSITESKHIKAVKRPWRRSSRNNPLGQMLLTNQRLDKLAAYRVDLESRGMLDGSVLPTIMADPAVQPQVLVAQADNLDEDEDGGSDDEPYSQGDVKLSKNPARGVPRQLDDLAVHINQPELPILIRQFLYNQRHLDMPDAPQGCDIPLDQCPELEKDQKIFLHSSARATFFAPSDLSGLSGMRHERIRATNTWYKGAARYDCVFMEGDAEKEGFQGLLVGRVFAFFRFRHFGRSYPCALVHWYSTVGDTPCPETGMWLVQPDFQRDGSPLLEVVHLDCLYRAAHLIGVTGDSRVPARDFSSSDSLDAYEAFYVNKYVDYHAHEVAY
ncbi:hypothetical protein VKT23_012902 [Stygiomarasmius scandens]|uniref:C2H2-type domain-containing protein n=1 Tax=Marasmiellus scandens TaxID=2682957 RepID=A0ABR1J4L9_9AGAR